MSSILEQFHETIISLIICRLFWNNFGTISLLVLLLLLSPLFYISDIIIIIFGFTVIISIYIC